MDKKTKTRSIHMVEVESETIIKGGVNVVQPEKPKQSNPVDWGDNKPKQPAPKKQQEK